jgi:hypothetical protein
MKTKTNIALEGTCNGDVVGGLYREPRENLQALLFGKGALWEAYTKGVIYSGFSITGTESLTEKPQRVKRKPMPNAY